MVLSIVCILLVAGIAYFHWVQGLFSATISMAMAVIASVVAIGYYETVATSLMGGKMADSANGMILCVLFMAIYGIGRIAFDTLIPGNVRLPLYVDRIGGGACGFIAGIFAVGTVAVAVQALPFGPSIAGFSRYAIAETRDVQVPGRRQQVDAAVTGSLEEAFPDPSKEIGLMLDVDQMVVNFATRQSREGSLAGSVPLEQQHPNLLRELFFQRVGIEAGAKHSALNIGGKTEVAVVGLFAPPSLKQIEGELVNIRGAQGNRKLSATLPDPASKDRSQALLVVRATVKLNATDQDKRLRFSPGMARLVVGGKDYYPIGTLHYSGDTMLAARIDDYLLAEMPPVGDVTTIDLVYEVNAAEVLGTAPAATPAAGAAAAAAAATKLHLKPGAFFEFKRYARVDLNEAEVAAGPIPATPVPMQDGKPQPNGGVMRKQPIRVELGLDTQ